VSEAYPEMDLTPSTVSQIPDGTSLERTTKPLPTLVVKSVGAGTNWASAAGRRVAGRRVVSEGDFMANTGASLFPGDR
jgi:hypothetical protein